MPGFAIRPMSFPAPMHPGASSTTRNYTFRGRYVAAPIFRKV